MRADRSKGLLRQVRITVKSEEAHNVFQSYRGGRLGLAVRAPDAAPFIPMENGSPARGSSEREGEPCSEIELGLRRL